MVEKWMFEFNRHVVTTWDLEGYGSEGIMEVVVNDENNTYAVVKHWFGMRQCVSLFGENGPIPFKMELP